MNMCMFLIAKLQKVKEQANGNIFKTNITDIDFKVEYKFYFFLCEARHAYPHINSV